eukprot:CAMPEP_0194215764 /NCGR_PEP_ID=MMETSP0156-20130528/17780_1 /TAXON_ID=33649 /ORGANISM="Thalassionema nitzschioides, Strain L26-B" /LENGTH=689 /DNA_ID=CAMNT_0038944367 /DNA_START=93 /DNA_END=2162 /DNA_ORIENTATION=-
MVEIDVNGIILLVNNACEECFQYDTAELLGENINMLMPEPYASQHGNYIQNYLKSGIPKVVEEGRKGRKLRALRKDGTTFPIYLSLSEKNVNGKRVFTGIMRNLIAEEQEKQILLAMQGLITSSIDPIVQIDCRGIIKLANPACCRVFQYTQEELFGKNINMLMPEPFRTQHSKFIENYLKTGVAKVVEKGRKGRTLTGQRKDGATFPLFLTLSEYLLNGERCFTGIMRNLSAEEEERQVLAAMIDSCVDPIVVIDKKGMIEKCNPACSSVFGYSKDELLGSNVTILMPEPHATKHGEYLEHYLNNNSRKRSTNDAPESHIVGRGRDLLGKKKSGQTFPIFLTVSEFEVDSTTSRRHGFIGIMRDMTEKEKAIAAEVERQKSEALLMNVLPHHISERLKASNDNHEHVQIADAHENVTILFADIVGFTQFCSGRTPMQVVHHLNKVFQSFDVLVDKYNMEKIKTIGDAYMAVGGLDGSKDHVYKMINFALEMLEVVERINKKNVDMGKHEFGVRIGLHNGSVVAGVVGTKRRFFDLWGDAVNIAARMESGGVVNCIHCTKDVAEEAKKYPKEFIALSRGTIDVKGKGEMESFIIAPTHKQDETQQILLEHKASALNESYKMHLKLQSKFIIEDLERGLSKSKIEEKAKAARSIRVVAKRNSMLGYSCLAIGSFIAGYVVSSNFHKSLKR